MVNTQVQHLETSQHIAVSVEDISMFQQTVLRLLPIVLPNHFVKVSVFFPFF